MTEQADVYIRNNLMDAIRVTRCYFQGGKCDPEIVITNGNEEKVYLVMTETYITIKAPTGVDPHECMFIVSNEELLSWETMNDHWAVKIKLNNNALPETPTTVNIDVGGPGQ